VLIVGGGPAPRLGGRVKPGHGEERGSKQAICSRSCRRICKHWAIYDRRRDRGNMKLQVHQVVEADVYKDIARIHYSQRKEIKEGRICRLSIGREHKLVAIRGLPDCEKGWIRIDDITRSRLGLPKFDGTFPEADFDIREVSFVGRIKWAWQASEPAARIAAQLGMVSLLIAIAAIPWADWTSWVAQHIRSCLGN
jgi:hypothetical protein